MALRLPTLTYTRWEDAARDLGSILRSTINDDAQPFRWRSMRIPLIAAQGAGLSAPDIIQFRDDGSGSTGVYAAAFSNVLEEEFVFSIDLPEDYMESTDIIPQLHWSPGSSTSTNTVRWGFEYTLQAVGSAFPTTSIIYVEDAGSGTAYDHQEADFSAISGSAITIETVLVGRVFRDSTHANDDFAADAFGLDLRIEYQCDTNRGARGKDSKWGST